MPEYPESEILTAHLPCPACGSHDALTEYTDGHTYCFSCRTHTCAAGTPKEPTKMSKQLIQTTGQYPVLTKRRISEATIRKFNYQTAETPAGIVHIAPYYNHSDELCAQHLRGAGKKFSWRGNTDKIQLFGQRLWNQGNRKVIITEGELDCMSISQIQDNKWPVVSIPSGAQGAAKAIKDNLDWLETFQEVVICFDTDQPGETAAMECAQILSPGKAKIAKLPLKDASDMLQAGRGKELLECIWNASTYRPEGIISGTDLWDAILKEPVKGHMTPFEKLNELTYGIRPAELWLFTAGSGIGKSTIVHEIGYKLLMQDKLKIGVMALEEPKEKTAKRYISIHINKPIYIDQTGITEATLRDAFDKTIGQKPCRFELYDHFGSTDIDLLIGKIRYMLVALDVDILILDHISIVVSGLDAGAISEGERRTLDILMSKLKSLTVETNKTILAVAHLKRPEQGKSWNEGKEPRLTDLRGSAALEQLSDMVIALYRDQSSEEESNTAGIIVLKNRPIGPVGKAGYVQYNQTTGRLLPTDGPDDSAQGFKKQPKPAAPPVERTAEQAEQDF